MVNHEVNIENDVSKKLNTIIDSQLTTVAKQKRVVAKCHQDNEAAKQKYQVSFLNQFASTFQLTSQKRSIHFNEHSNKTFGLWSGCSRVNYECVKQQTLAMLFNQSHKLI